MKKRSFVITRTDSGKQLAAVLRDRFRLDWSAARQLVKNQQVLVDGKVCKKHSISLRKGQTLEITGELPADLPPGVVAAPAVVDLTRTADHALPRGTITRRFERGASFCRVMHPATLLRCADDRLSIEVIEPRAPGDWVKCSDEGGVPTVIELPR